MSTQTEYTIIDGKVVLHKKYVDVIHNLHIIEHDTKNENHDISCVACLFNRHVNWVEDFQTELQKDLPEDRITQLMGWFKDSLKQILEEIRDSKISAESYAALGKDKYLHEYPVNCKPLFAALENALKA